MEIDEVKIWALLLAWFFHQSRKRLGFGFLQWVSVFWRDGERVCFRERNTALLRERRERIVGLPEKRRVWCKAGSKENE